MKILYVSVSASNRLQKELFDKYKLSLGFAVQKFNKMLEKGFSRNDMEIEAVSIVSIPKALAPFKFKYFKSEKERNVNYWYVPYIRFVPIYHTFLFLCIMIKVFWWTLRNRNEGVVICDPLIHSLSVGTMLGSALARGKRIALVTDMPGISPTKCTYYKDMNLIDKLQVWSIHHFSGYVFLADPINEHLNPNNRPHIIIEGLVDPDMKPQNNSQKNITRDIMYAGGLEEEYGLGYLCEAFMKLEDRDIRLVFYGDGPFKSKIEEYAVLDSRIVYMGTASNDIIVDAERKSTLLVNPRFTSAEYTLYTFPSKNIEYMVSGTPLVTTKLAGIPKDYYPYIYTFDDETIEGYISTLRNVLNHSDEQLRDFGYKAQQYILKNKNTKVQVQKLMDLIPSL